MYVTLCEEDVVRYHDFTDIDDFEDWLKTASAEIVNEHKVSPTFLMQTLQSGGVLVCIEKPKKEKRMGKEKENIWKLEDEKETKQETVRHPKHYQTCNIECFDLMKLIFGQETTNSFCLMNAFKYIYRFREKGGEEDLKKAEQYLDFYAAESIDKDDLEEGEPCRNDELYNELMELIEKYTGRL